MQPVYQENEDALEHLFKGNRRWANLAIVLINILIFAAAELTGSSEDAGHMLSLGALYVPCLQDGQLWRLLTAMFLHFGLYHLTSNMILLLFIGDMFEEMTGHLRYLIVFLGGGILGNLLSALMQLRSGDFYVAAGASGGVFAIVGGLLAVLIHERGQTGRLTGRRLAIIAVLSLYEGFTTTGIDAFAHAGGFAGGFLLALLLCKRNSGGGSVENVK